MGLRFCNEAIMSLHQIWPRLEEPSRESLSPLQVSMPYVHMCVQGIDLVESVDITKCQGLSWSTTVLET